MDTNGNYIQNQFCSYEIALKLKELGFDEECFKVYDDLGFLQAEIEMLTLKLPYLKAPLLQQVEQWLRDTYNYYIAVYRLNNKWCGEVYDILRQCYITSNAFDGVLYDTYEEAREQAILKAIGLCQKKNKF